MAEAVAYGVRCCSNAAAAAQQKRQGVAGAGQAARLCRRLRQLWAPQPQQPGKTLAELRAQASQRQPSVQPPPSQPADEQQPSQPPPRPADLA